MIAGLIIATETAALVGLSYLVLRQWVSYSHEIGSRLTERSLLQRRIRNQRTQLAHLEKSAAADRDVALRCAQDVQRHRELLNRYAPDWQQRELLEMFFMSAPPRQNAILINLKLPEGR